MSYRDLHNGEKAPFDAALKEVIQKYIKSPILVSNGLQRMLDGEIYGFCWCRFGGVGGC